MQDLTQYIPYVGVALVGAAWALGNPKVKEYVAKIGKVVKPHIPFMNKSNTIDVEETADITEALQYLSVHELLEELLGRAEESSDSEGLMLLGAYGKHVYDLRLEPKPVVTNAKKSTKKGG